MKKNVKQYLAAFLAAAMVVTALPSSAVRAAGEGDAAAGGTETVAVTSELPVTMEQPCVKFVRAGAESVKTGTDGGKAHLIGTNEKSATGSAKAAAFVDGETGKGDQNVGSARVAAMAFDLPEKSNIESGAQLSAQLEITIFDGNDRLSNGTETKAAIFQVAADKFNGMADDLTSNAPGATFPAKDGYAKDKTVYGDGWIKYHNYTAQDQKITFDVTEWVKAAIEAGESHAIFRLQTVVGGFFVYDQNAGVNAPKLSITTATEEQLVNQTLQNDYDALKILNADDVRGNLSLIKKGSNGSDITWTSDKTAIVEAGTADSGLYDGGIVHRPAAGGKEEEVHLTATLAYGGKSRVKEFTVKVQPLPENLDTDYTAGYLWAHFGTQDGYEKMFFGYSEDGLAWNKLNKVDGVAQAVLENSGAGSDLGVRDPHLIRSAEGDRYWILGTDLHAEGGGAGGSGWNQLSASQNLVVWESTDLVNWSEPRLVYAGFENAGCIWAPEAIYDDTTGDYVVYWSSRDKSKAGTEENALRVYVCRTRDFNTFSEPKVWLSEDQDSGSEVNIIDSSIVKSNGKFYRFSTSDWNTVIDVSDTLDTEDVLDVRKGEAQSTPDGSWKRLVTRSKSSDAGFDGREGFTVYQLPDGTWCMMGDNSGYKAFVTDDLATLGTTKVTEADASFDERFRHGTVVRLSEAEEARVLEAYKDTESPVEDPVEEPILRYDFEEETEAGTITDKGLGDEKADNGTLYGSAAVVYDEELKSNVLKLDGANGGYAEIPKGFFDNKNVMTISMDVKSEKDSGNFFTFTYGKNSTIYDFLRIRGTEVRNAATLNSWGSEKEVSGTGAVTGTWQKVVIVINRQKMKLYLDGSLVSENANTGILTSAMGTDLLAYLGKSFYDDAYFKGSFDNFVVYNRELSKEEIVADVLGKVPMLKSVTIGTAPDRETALEYRGTDDHTAILSSIDRENKVITSYLRKGADLTAVPVTLNTLSDNAVVTAGQEAFTGTMDLSSDAEITISYNDNEGTKTETYTVKKPILCNNPVLPGQYADPDIDYFDGKFWIYPTTDGYPSWSGDVFHAFSSPDMVNWTDEGIIMQLANDNPGLNDKGVQIAKSPWAVKGSAWAPTIEKKNDKYYFYYCGKDSSGASQVGVAVADHPAGPYTDKGEPLVTKAMCDSAGAGVGQAIDPSIFTDDDGKSYILLGNGSAAIAELNDDMMSIKEGTLKRINGLTDFRESVIVTKKDGIYHWTWTCDDANSPNYHVNYGTSETLLQADGTASVTLKKKNLLSKDESKGMLGTGHQSVLHIKDESGNDRYFMAYHRFYTPLGIFTSADGYGKHRETCIDEIFFDENGEMIITPTLEGVGAVQAANDQVIHVESVSLDKKSLTLKVDETAALQAAVAPANATDKTLRWSSDKETIATVDEDGVVTAKAEGRANITVTSVNGKTAACVVTVEKKTTGGGPVEVTSVSLDPTMLTLKAKETATLKATVQPAGAVTTLTWKSGNQNVATVANGVVTANAAGETTITVTTANGKSASCTVTVSKDAAADPGTDTTTKVPVTSVKLNKTKAILGVKEKFTIQAAVQPANATDNRVKFSTSNKRVATVTQKGVVTAKKKGTATITVTAGGKTAKCKITVKAAPKRITLNKTKVNLKKKKTFQIKVKLPKNTASNKITYKSSNKKVASVSTSGKVKAIKKGNATITVTTFNGKKAKLKVKVK